MLNQETKSTTASKDVRPERLPVLDGVRGCAILMVIIWHYGHCLVINTANLPPDHLAFRILSYCGMFWSGVDLFFVLSGFLIGGILLDNRMADNYFKVFYVRRILRIFPIYYISVGLFLLAGWFGLPPAYDFLVKGSLPAWSYVTFTQNIAMAWKTTFGPSWLDATWSLAIEEQFYLLIPFLIWYFSRTTLYGIIFFTILGAPLLRMMWPGFSAFVGLPWRADALMLGVLLACAIRSAAFREFCRCHRLAVQGGWLMLVIGFCIMSRGMGNFGVFSFSWLNACYAGIILIGLSYEDSWLAAFLRSRFLLWLGRLSYGIYLSHQVVIGFLFASFAGKPPGINCLRDMGLVLAALGITFILTELSYRFFEKPILAYGRWFTYHLSSTTVSAISTGIAGTTDAIGATNTTNTM
ncbi:MAG: acyltransferase [Candidatus Ozemobacteraceae bacterium]